MNYEIKKSTRPGKKYMAVYPDGHKVHFGAMGYGHFRDSTPLKLYSHLDHNDDDRQKRYTARHLKIKLKDGRYAAKVPGTSAYFALKYLWS